MKKILIRVCDLPLSVAQSRICVSPNPPTPAPNIQAPVLTVRVEPEKLSKIMCEVIVDHSELIVLKSFVDNKLYALNKPLGVELIEPDDDLLNIYQELYDSGIPRDKLNIHHYEIVELLLSKGKEKTQRYEMRARPSKGDCCYVYDKEFEIYLEDERFNSPSSCIERCKELNKDA